MTAIEAEVLADAPAVARRAAELLTAACADRDGPLRVCLSGGSTPKLLYELLAKPAYRKRLPWPRIHWFWGDERCVPPDHPHSNFGMVRRALLDPAAVPAANIHPMRMMATAATSAAAYEVELQRHYGAARLDPARPLFDVTFLGLGEDGHTASLFPGVAALQERERWTAAVIGAKPEPRLSLTFPVLNSSRLALMLVTGASKYAALQRLQAGDDLPAAQLRPQGRLLWLFDEAANTG